MKKSDEYMAIGRAMMEYFRQFKSYIKIELSDYNLSFAEVLTMLSLYEQNGQSAEMLLDSVSYDKSVMTRTLQSLEAKEFVKRQRNNNDGRSWLFSLTADGNAAMVNVFPVLMSWSEFAFDGFEESEVLALLKSMNKIMDNITK